MSVEAAVMRIPIGVVVERCKANSPWSEFVWRPVAVLGGVPDTNPWTQLAIEVETIIFYAGASQIELYRSDAANYRDNLLSAAPSVWVELLATEGDPPYGIGAVTVDPAEAEALAAGQGIVEAVPMPDSVHNIITSFISKNRVERTFEKRKRIRGDPEAPARRDPHNRGGAE
jgi:Protein of unknown function (DUF3305)